MKKILELLINERMDNMAGNLYYPGQEFTGIIEEITNEEVIILNCNGIRCFLDSTSLFGFALPREIKGNKSKYKEETLLVLKNINNAKRPSKSVIEMIKENVTERVLQYQEIEKEVQKIICQMENYNEFGVDQILLFELEGLKIRKPGCFSALNTLSAGLHYVGGNKEIAIKILWETSRYEIALAIIDEIWDDQIYLDCLGYAVSDFDPDSLKWYQEAFCYYVKQCADLGDISLLMLIIEATLKRRKSINNIFREVLYFLIQKKESAIVKGFDGKETFSVLLNKVRQLYPNGENLLLRQESLPGRLNSLFANAPVHIKKKKESLVTHINGTREMIRPQYYIGIISDRFITENDFFQFRVKLDPRQTEEIYMHSYQVADPLLLHKLNTSQDYLGTKICFRFGNNDKGICAADAIMEGKERNEYRMLLADNKKNYDMPNYYNYLSINRDEGNQLKCGEFILEQAAEAGDKEDINQIELIIFFYNCIMNMRSWRNMGYPCAIKNCSEIVMYLENWNIIGSQVEWASGLIKLLNQGGHKDWADIFQSLREGLSQTHPLYMAPKPNRKNISRENLMSSYIFPEVVLGDYEHALEDIKYWKQLSTNNRKNKGAPWDRVCILEEVCKAGLNGDRERFSAKAHVLWEKVTESQRKILKELFEVAGVYGGEK